MKIFIGVGSRALNMNIDKVFQEIIEPNNINGMVLNSIFNKICWNQLLLSKSSLNDEQNGTIVNLMLQLQNPNIHRFFFNRTLR